VRYLNLPKFIGATVPACANLAWKLNCRNTCQHKPVKVSVRKTVLNRTLVLFCQKSKLGPHLMSCSRMRRCSWTPQLACMEPGRVYGGGRVESQFLPIMVTYEGFLRGPSASEHRRTSVPSPARVSAFSHMGLCAVAYGFQSSS
jgi:hypothetical protein